MRVPLPLESAAPKGFKNRLRLELPYRPVDLSLLMCGAVDRFEPVMHWLDRGTIVSHSLVVVLHVFVVVQGWNLTQAAIIGLHQDLQFVLLSRHLLARRR